MLYSPHPPSNVIEIQQQLQAIQKSDNGKDLANELLAHEEFSNNVKYFGALTYTVQLNTNVTSEEILLQLFKGNLIHFTRISAQYALDPHAHNNLLIIIKKLMSNLSLIFTNVNENVNSYSLVHHWNNPINTMVKLISSCSSEDLSSWQLGNSCVDHLISEAINCSVPYDQLIHFIQSSASLNRLALLFTEVIVEDLSKFQSRRTSMSKVYATVHEHLYISTVSIVNYNLQVCLSEPANSSSEVTGDLFRCVNAWVSYSSMARNNSPHGKMDLSEMFEHLISLMCLHSGNENFPYSTVIVAILDDVFSNDPLLMNYDLRTKIEGIFLGVSKSGKKFEGNEWMMQYMNFLVTNEMFEELKELSSCVFDFLQIGNLDLCNKLFTAATTVDLPTLQQYIKVLLQMTNFPLVPVSQEFFSSKMVDFWLDLCDAYQNLAPDSLRPDTTDLATDIFAQVIEIYLPKISLLNKQKILQDDDDLLHEFDDFRNAVLDLTESLWSVLGNSKLTGILIAGVGQPSTNVDIFQVEAMSFLLNKLLSNMTLSECPQLCESIASNGAFIENVLLLLQTGCQQQAQDKSASTLKLDFVKTSSFLIGTIADYFKLNKDGLGKCVDTLFQCLETCRNNNGQDTANKMELMLTKSLTSLCKVCRNELTFELPNFISILHAMMQPNSPVSYFTREKFFRSMGYIIQSFVESGPEAQGKYIIQMVEVIEDGIRVSEGNREHTLCLLTCLSELGSGLICPGEIENTTYLQHLNQFKDFWKSDPLQVRARIINILQHVLDQYSKDSEFVEIGCLIIGKALPLPDDEPHFLSYDMGEIMKFMLRYVGSCDLSTCLPYLVNLFEKVVVRYKSTLTFQDFDFVFSKFFLDHYQQSIVDDPDLLQVMINFVNLIMELKPSLAINSAHWSSFILPEFLKFLPATEKFTVTAITKFWCRVVNNKKFTREDEDVIKSQVLSLGQQLVFQTLYASLHTQRSDLQYYTELLRALVAKYPLQLKPWMLQALPQVHNNNVAHERLVNKLFVTRGSRAASNVVLEWWLDCNGLPQLN